MSDDTGRDDTVLGTALARAIDSQPVRATPFAQSRLAMRRAGGGRSPLMPVLAAAAAIVLGLALGAALLGQRGDERGPVATEPTASPAATTEPSPSPSPSATPRGPIEQLRMFLVRDQLPPVAVVLPSEVTESTPEGRVAARLTTLFAASSVSGGDAINAMSDVRGQRQVSAVSIASDLATVEFDISDWGVRGAAQTQALVQQLVYTITEEPGIRRALIKEKGKTGATIDQLVIDKPLSREDVLPYEGVKTEERVALEDDPRPATLTTKVSDPVAPGLTRIEILMTANAPVSEGFWSPRMSAELRANNDERALPGKWLLEITLPGGTDPKGSQVQTIDGSPLRAVRVTTDASGTRYLLGLDDARPWRVSLEPIVASPAPPTPSMRLLVDIGGHPQAVSDSVAVYDPPPGTDLPSGGTRIFRLMGAARAFEAHVAWRLKDSRDREVATGFVTASLGTSPVWGTFTTEVKVPDNVSGVVTLEVFWPSPRDGAPVGLVALPLRVR